MNRRAISLLILAVSLVFGGITAAATADTWRSMLDQFPEGELARGTAKRFNVPIHDSIANALTLGTGRLAVDGVVIIGEHGDYPKNERGLVETSKRLKFPFLAGSSLPVTRRLPAIDLPYGTPLAKSLCAAYERRAEPVSAPRRRRRD